VNAPAARAVAASCPHPLADMHALPTRPVFAVKNSCRAHQSSPLLTFLADRPRRPGQAGLGSVEVEKGGNVNGCGQHCKEGGGGWIGGRCARDSSGPRHEQPLSVRGLKGVALLRPTRPGPREVCAALRRPWPVAVHTAAVNALRMICGVQGGRQRWEM
jgi:hypothetical protein